MKDYILPFEITNNMLNLAASIMKKIGKLDNYKDLNENNILYHQSHYKRNIYISQSFVEISLRFSKTYAFTLFHLLAILLFFGYNVRE